MKANFMTIEVRGLKRRVKRLSDALFDIQRTHGNGAISSVMIDKMTPTRIAGTAIVQIPITPTQCETKRCKFRAANGRVKYLGKERTLTR